MMSDGREPGSHQRWGGEVVTFDEVLEQARTELGAARDLCQAMDMTFWLPQVEAVLAQAEEQL